MAKGQVISDSVKETIQIFAAHSVELIDRQIKEHNNKPFPFIAAVFALKSDGTEAVAATTAHNLVVKLDADDGEVRDKLQMSILFLKSLAHVLATACVDHAMVNLEIPIDGKETAIHGISYHLLNHAAREIDEQFLN